MIEIFRTNVRRKSQAQMLLARIHRNYKAYTANFDLQDRDKILRVKSATGEVSVSCLIGLLRHFGFQAELLPDHPGPTRLLPLPGHNQLKNFNN
jgi:hypothetical protein